MRACFSKSHDAIDPHSFMISAYGINIGVITDIDHACKEVIACFSQCHAAFLESNYCEDMFASGNYPYHLKKELPEVKGICPMPQLWNYSGNMHQKIYSYCCCRICRKIITDLNWRPPYLHHMPVTQKL